MFRNQTAMATVTPRHVICALGNWRDLDEVEAVVRQAGDSQFRLDREFSQLCPDSRMTRAFEASYDRVAPSMTDDDWYAVQKHNAVAYVLSPPIQKDSADRISGLALSLTAALLQRGGVAAKGESAGIAHGRAHWLQLAEDYRRAQAENDGHTACATLYRTWVRRPLIDRDETVYYSCGMHLLGDRDVEVESTWELSDALDWMDALGLYLVADRPTRPLKDGEGFRVTNDGPRCVMRLRPCRRYEEDDFLFNPHGYIRLEPTTGAKRQ